ncbi:MAG: DUF2007 domain-containing protein [Planctomycetaceae bacterium]|nr:DUF2007 domain-containing protein [Planctomycetaceae bacterium]
MPDEMDQNLVVAASAATLRQADVLKAVLEANGIPTFIPGALASNCMPHMEIGLNPKGVRLLVRKKDLNDALEILNHPQAIDADEVSPADTDQDVSAANDYARKAFYCSVCWMLFAPLAVMIPWFIARAIIADSRREAENSSRFQRHIILASVLGLVPFVLLVYFLRGL